MDAYTLYAVNVDIAGGSDSDILIDQVENFSLDPAINRLLLQADGNVYPTYVTVMGQSPVIGFTTSKLAAVLAKCGLTGLAIAADVDEPGVECWWHKLAEGGTRAAGSSHLKMTVKKGIIVPRTLNAPIDGHATIAYDTIPTYDGTNDPIVIAGNQALSGSPGVSEVFTCGKVMINGAQLEGVQNISVDFGIRLTIIKADGLVWPTYVAIIGIQPLITIATVDLGCISTLGLTGAAQGATDSIIYLRKLSEGGTRVADNVAEHISLTIDEGHISVQNANSGGDANATANVEIAPTYDGTNAPIVFNTATTIS